MASDDLAKVAVTITQVIKENLNETAEEVINKILIALPGVSVDSLSTYLTSMGKALAIEHLDVHSLIIVLQERLNGAVSDIHWNTLLQDIAQGIYYVACMLEKLLPPKWLTVITAVLWAYQKLKEE